MLFKNEEPFVRQALHVHPTIKNSARDFFKPLQSRDSRLFYILDGKGAIVVDGFSYELQSDMAILFKAGTTYEWQIEWADYYVLNFDYSQEYAHIRQTFHPLYSDSYLPEHCLNCGVIEDIPQLEEPLVLQKAISSKHLIQNIIAESAITDEWSETMLSTLLKQVILELLRSSHPGKDIKGRAIIKQVIAYIQDHYNEPITNSKIARLFGYNPTYLGRIFKQYTHSTLYEFIIDLRLSAAMEALKDTRLSIGEVAQIAGIPDIYHFSKLFKQKTGQTPKEYRNRRQ